MRKKILKHAFGIFGILTLTFLFLACPDEVRVDDKLRLPDGIQIHEQQGKVVVSFSILESTARTIFPQIDLDDVAVYKLFGGISDATETELLEFTNEDVPVSIGLNPGIWNFTLNAYDENDGHLLQGSVEDKEITLTGINQVSFFLSPLSGGTGKIQIILNFPEEAGITRISVSGDISPENFITIDSDNFVYTKNNVTTGECFVNFELYQGDVLRTTVSELVLVRKNLTSSKTITLAGDDLKPILTGTMSISGVVLVGETLIADTNDLNGVGSFSYQWKSDETNIDGAINDLYIVQNTDIGKVITVTVTRVDYFGSVTSTPTIAVPALVNVTVDNVTGDGNETQTTTVLTLAFDETIAGLSANDITITTTTVTGTMVKGIPTASGSNYTLPISGFSSGGTVTVTVTKSGYNITGSHSVPIHCYSPPLTGTVGITGTLQTGQVLTADTANLNGTGTITYQWKRGTTIVGTNSSTYTVVAADVGNTFTLTVTRAYYSDSVTSLPMLTGTVNINSTPLLQLSEILTVTTSFGESGDISYQWKRGTTNIGTNNTYTIQSADIGSTITVTVTRIGNSGYITSSATPTIGVLTGTVNITGTAYVGETLTANTASLGGSGTISYQWRRVSTTEGTITVGTNSSTYIIQPADAGSRITVTVTRANNTDSKTSSQTAAVTLPPLTGTVSITGTAAVGVSLGVNTTSLGGSGALSYQWKRGGNDISGATNSTYTVHKDDEAYTITVTVTRINTTGSVTSAAVAVPKTLNWNSTPPAGIGNGDIIIIASGASGTLVIPENAIVTIGSSGTGVDNSSRAITLNISPNAKVIWNAIYESSASTSVTIVGTGTLDVAAGNIHSSGSGAISTSSNSTIIVSGGTVSSWPYYGATITSTNTSGIVMITGGIVVAYGNNNSRQAINASGTLNITGGLVIAELANTTGNNGVVSQAITPTGTGTIIGYTLGSSHTSGETNGLTFLPTTGANVSWGLRNTWETGINYRGNFYPVSGVSVGNRIVWNSNRVPSSSFIATGSTITIESGANGTLTVPENVTTTIVSQGTDIVDNGSNRISLSIGANSKIIWNANYSYSYSYIGYSAVTVDGTGTFEVSGGKLINTNNSSSSADAINTTNSTIIVSGGTVSAFTGSTIYSSGTSGIVTISGGIVTTTTGVAINTRGSSSTVTISGGVVSATTGTAINASGSFSTVTISGGVVSTTTGTAINSNANALLEIIGGLVIAQRNAILGTNGVISRTANALSGNGRIIGYATGAYNVGTTGATGTEGTIDATPISNGLIIQVPVGISNAGVTWGANSGQSGINYPGGFFGTTGVSVIGSGGAAIIFSEDFESTNSFTIVNGTEINQWYRGTAAAYAGTWSAYITNNSGTSNAYTHTTSTVHMYRDVTFTSSTTHTLGFYWRAEGESASYDYLKVYLTETSFTPVAGTRPTESSSVVLLGTYVKGGVSTWNYASLSIPASNSGTTKRLIFTWYNDSGGGTQPPVAVDNILLTR